MLKGTLKKIADQKNLLADLTIFAESEQESFSEVQIITLKQHLKELALEKALNDFDERGKPGNAYRELHEHVNNLRVTEYSSAKEYVLITQDSIQIGVNKSTIDDDAIDYALSLLLRIETFNPGEKYEFGKRVKPCL